MLTDTIKRLLHVDRRHLQPDVILIDVAVNPLALALPLLRNPSSIADPQCAHLGPLHHHEDATSCLITRPGARTGRRRCKMRDRGDSSRSLLAPAPPPPYEAAVYRRLWSVVAPYVQDFDLYSACLVCRQWHHIFSPLLWGNPGLRFGNDSDNIYRKSAQLLHSTPPSSSFFHCQKERLGCCLGRKTLSTPWLIRPANTNVAHVT